MKKRKVPMPHFAANLKGTPEAAAAVERIIREVTDGEPASIVGACQRELTARHLLLHPELVKTAPAADLEALREYINRKGWRVKSSNCGLSYSKGGVTQSRLNL